MLGGFPLRVHPKKLIAWLELVSKVPGRNPDLRDWDTTGTPWNDLFLDWVMAERENPEGEFRQELMSCLVRGEARTHWGLSHLSLLHLAVFLLGVCLSCI